MSDAETGSATGARLLPLSLTLLSFVADQATKALVVANIPYQPGRPGLGADLFGGLVRIIHTRNLGIAFSLGRDFGEPLRILLFTVLPIAVLGVLVYYFLRSDDFTRLQRWCLAGILGGGLGNLTDRIFRPYGVVDFVDVKFYGLFGLDRWPTFNVADATVVVCGLLLAASVLFGKRKSS